MASLPAMLIDENKELKARVAELEGKVERLQKERDYSVRWANTSVDSIKEHMWKQEDALQRIADFHIGDCPAAVEELDFAKSINREIRKIAFAALSKAEGV